MSATNVSVDVTAKKPRASKAAAAPKAAKATKAAAQVAVVAAQAPAGKKRRVRKHKKDPNAPKRSQTPFLLFSTEVRPQVKAQNPALTFGATAKHISQMWKNLSAEQKRPYTERAEADKANWRQARAQYEEAHRKPKKNCTPFIIYSNKFRDAVKAATPNITFGQVAQTISDMWKKLSEAEKKPYETDAEADKARYAAEMVQYRLTHPEPVKEKKVRAPKAPSTKAPSTKAASTKAASTKAAKAADAKAPSTKKAASTKAAPSDKKAKATSTKKAAAAPATSSKKAKAPSATKAEKKAPAAPKASGKKAKAVATQ